MTVCGYPGCSNRAEFCVGADLAADFQMFACLEHVIGALYATTLQPGGRVEVEQLDRP